MPPVMEDIEKNIKTIGEGVDGMQKTLAEVQGKQAEIMTDKENMLKAVESLRAAIKAMESKTFDSEGRYHGILPSRKHAELVGHWALARKLGKDDAKKSYDYLEKANVDLASIASVVPSTIASMILDLVQGMYGVFRQNCRIWPGDPSTIPTLTGDVTWGVPGEATAQAESKPTLSYVPCTYKEFVGMTYVTREADEDAIVSLGELIARSFSRSLAATEDNIGFNGTGGAGAPYYGYTGAFYGIGAAGAIETINATLLDLELQDILNLIALLPEDFDPDAKFYCHRTIWAYLLGMKDRSGRQMAWVDVATRQKMFLGYPLITSSKLTAASGVSAGTPFLRFGSLFDAATIAEKRAFKIEESSHYKFADRVNTILASQRKAFASYNKGDGSNPGAIVELKLKS